LNPRLTCSYFFPLVAIFGLLFTSFRPLGAQPYTDDDGAPKKPKKVHAHPKLDVIVLDAGHGGRDAGAVGTHGYKEKQATLAIILKLGALIEEALPDVQVVYTRKSDTFIELDRRGAIANEHQGKLFISVHCNSTPKKPSKAKGFTTYILRPGKTDAAINVAARENAVVAFEENSERYSKLSDLDFILTSMARSHDVKFSEQFASLVQNQLKTRVATRDNGVSQAGFSDRDRIYLESKRRSIAQKPNRPK
jgi:N-acetylmuramoyl-L-alanine amidase